MDQLEDIFVAEGQVDLQSLAVAFVVGVPENQRSVTKCLLSIGCVPGTGLSARGCTESQASRYLGSIWGGDQHKL